jgi:dihydrofolate reductase
MSTPKPRIRFYVAVSLDGFIADSEGSVDWLEPYPAERYGFAAFASEVAAVVIGRRTYEHAALGDVWPYAGTPTFVVASRALKDLPAGCTLVRNGVPAALAAARAAAEGKGDVWVVGGAVTMRTCLDAGEVDVVDLFKVPVLLGSGLSLLGSLRERRTLEFDSFEIFKDGVVKLHYVLGAGGRRVDSKGSSSR